MYIYIYTYIYTLIRIDMHIYIHRYVKASGLDLLIFYSQETERECVREREKGRGECVTRERRREYTVT